MVGNSYRAIKTRLAARIALFLVSALSCLHSSSSLAGEAPVQKQVSLQYQVTVSLKLLQVYVTDKGGKPVEDLNKDEFVILDNGKPVKITDFEKHGLRSPGPGESVQPQAISKLNRKFVLLFDFGFNTQKGVAASMNAALHFLDTDVRPQDEVAVVSYSMLKGIRVHEYLTLDHAKARSAVANLTVKEIAGRAEDVEQRYWMLAEYAEEGASEEIVRELSSLQAQRKEAKIQAQNYMEGLIALAGALRLVPGQKNVLLFSTGTPNTLIYGNPATKTQASSAVNRGPGTPGQTDWRTDDEKKRFSPQDPSLQPLYEKMIKDFAAANCALFSLDTKDAAKAASMFAFDEVQFENRSGGFFASGGVLRSVTTPFQDEKTTGADPLRRFSKRTGGQYFPNINVYEKSLSQVEELTGSYYVLGYPYSAPADGRFREIKVEVTRKDCQVRAQSGFFNPKPFREFTKLEKELHLFDLALNERSELSAPEKFPMAALVYDAGEGARLRTLSRIPSALLGRFAGKKTEIVALFFDAENSVLSLQRTTMDPQKYREGDLVFTAGIAPPPGAVKARLIMRDLETGQSAIASAGAFVPKTAEAAEPRLTLCTPLLLAAGSSSAQLDGALTGQLDLLSWHDVYPYDATRLVPILGEVASGAQVKITAAIPLVSTGSSNPNIYFSANLAHAGSGQSTRLSVSPVDHLRQNRLDVYFIEIGLDAVPHGSYVLYIHAGDKATGALANTRVPIRLD